LGFPNALKPLTVTRTFSIIHTAVSFNHAR